MTRDDVLSYCLSKPAAVETYPFGEDHAVIVVAGKMFALVSLTGQPATVNLKCDPAYAVELRAAHAAVQPGYHMNKRHWNTVTLDGSLDEDELRGLVDDSYDLVVARLPRRLRCELNLPA